MSWLRRHAFNVHTKDLSIEQKTLFEITSHKDHIGHDLNILFTYFNNFEDLYFLKNIDLEREYSFNYPDTLLTSKEQQHLIDEINRFFSDFEPRNRTDVGHSHFPKYRYYVLG